MRTPHIAWQSKAPRSNISDLKLHNYLYQNYTGNHVYDPEAYDLTYDIFYGEI